jgi:hypothetical protein
MRKKEEIGVTILFILIGLTYLLAATQYSVGDISNLGPGFTPRLLGAVFLILSGYLLVTGLIGRRGKDGKKFQADPEPGSKVSVQVALVTLILVLYVAVMNFIGFALSTFLAIIFCSRLMGLEGWRKPTLLSVGTVVLTLLLFVFFLDIPLPAGRIWEW